LRGVQKNFGIQDTQIHPVESPESDEPCAFNCHPDIRILMRQKNERSFIE
jgi:hypothetical protein